MKKLDLEICRKLREEGHTYQEIADYFKVSKQAVFDLLDKAVHHVKLNIPSIMRNGKPFYKEGYGIHTIAKNITVPLIKYIST